MPKRNEKKIDNIDKLTELIDKLETRLSIFNKNELKEKVVPQIQKMYEHCNDMEEICRQLEYLFDLNFEEVHYPVRV